MFYANATWWGGGIRPADRLRDTIHLVVGVFIWGVVLRTWLIQGVFIPVVVSSGSMAPVFLGPHRSLDCDRCGTTFAIGTDRSRPGGRARCPTCGNGAIAVDSAAIRSGDRLIIDRSAFMLRTPRRWEAVLFREPEQANRLALKRIVGLPGELVRIEHGDVVIDGEISRKQLADQRRVAQLVHRVGRPEHASHSRWRPRDKSSAWTREETAFCYRPTSAGTGSTVAWLDYHHPGRHGVTDDMSYNPGESRLLSPVRDLMMVFQVTAGGYGELDLQAAYGQSRFEVRILLGQDRIALLRDGRLIKGFAWPMAPFRQPTKIEFSSFDAQIVLAVGGTVCLQVPYEPDGARRNRHPPLALGCRGISVRVERLEVWRDVYYTRPPEGGWGVDRAYRCGPDEVFVLGDNSPIAYDSRRWPRGGLPRRLLVGRVLTGDRFFAW